jgi:hypothetical protein
MSEPKLKGIVSEFGGEIHLLMLINKIRSHRATDAKG